MQTQPFGAVNPVDHVPGAEVLFEEKLTENSKNLSSYEDTSDSDSDWIDIEDGEESNKHLFSLIKKNHGYL